MKIKINANERVFVTGKTGSGKSVLVKNLLLPQLDNFVIYDYKHEIELPPPAVVFTSLDDFRHYPNTQQIIYRPQLADSTEFNGLCYRIFRRGANVLVMDEVADHTTASKIEPQHDIIMRLGRSRGVGCINCTQRPIGVHNNIISQSEHYFIFETTLPGDRKKLAGIIGDKVLEIPPKYHYWYYTPAMREPVLCKPVKIRK